MSHAATAQPSKPMPRLPQRIVCLTTETVEVLYALGEQDRIVGISGYTVRPPIARKEKPKVFAFTTGDIDKILATQPDLVLTFSDLQSEISRDLIKAGVPVYAFNMRSVDDILGMIETVGRLVGAETKALAIVAELEAQIARTRAIAAERFARTGKKPRVYFEEWDEPLISGIRWASELIEIAGGEDVFARTSPLATGQGPPPNGRRRDRCRAGHHHRLVVRQALPPGARCGAPRLAGGSRGQQRKNARNQISRHPDPRPGGNQRGTAPVARYI